MRRLILIVVILHVLFGVGITVARAIGLRQPLPIIAQQLHMHDCESPCFMGVTAGKTTFKDALLSLTNTPSSPDNERNLSHVEDEIIDLYLRKGNSQQIDVHLHFLNDIAYRIEVGLDDLEIMPTFGNIVAQYGFPACSRESWGNNHFQHIYIYDKKHEVFISFVGVYPIAWDSQIFSMLITVDPDGEEFRTFCSCSKWKGFGREYASLDTACNSTK